MCRMFGHRWRYVWTPPKITEPEQPLAERYCRRCGTREGTPR